MASLHPGQPPLCISFCSPGRFCTRRVCAARVPGLELPAIELKRLVLLVRLPTHCRGLSISAIGNAMSISGRSPSNIAVRLTKQALRVQWVQFNWPICGSCGCTLLHTMPSRHSQVMSMPKGWVLVSGFSNRHSLFGPASSKLNLECSNHYNF